MLRSLFILFTLLIITDLVCTREIVIEHAKHCQPLRFKQLLPCVISAHAQVVPVNFQFRHFSPELVQNGLMIYGHDNLIETVFLFFWIILKLCTWIRYVIFTLLLLLAASHFKKNNYNFLISYLYK